MKLLQLWNYSSKLPFGKSLVTQLLCHKIPFFKTIKPKLLLVEPNRCEASMQKTKFIINHLGSIHAIALCNMAEFAGGVMCEVSIPSNLRWIPQGMQVEYIKKATTDLNAIATPNQNLTDLERGVYVALVEIFDMSKDLVFRANIEMKVSERQ